LEIKGHDSKSKKPSFGESCAKPLLQVIELLGTPSILKNVDVDVVYLKPIFTFFPLPFCKSRLVS
jgi:hypothetical protein